MKNPVLILLCMTLAVLLIVPTVSAKLHTPVTEGSYVDFHGHFRINYYSDSKSDNDDFNDDDTSAARWRFMPTIDYHLSDDVMFHMQLRIGQFHEGKYNGRWRFNDPDASPAFDLRQGYAQVKLTDQITGTAGIIPMSDKFGDTLFSSDWDFAPLGLVFTGNVNDLDYRIGTGKLYEGTEGGKGADDDVDLYLVDLGYQAYGVTFLYLIEHTDDLTAAVDLDRSLLVYGVRGGHDIGNVNISGFLLGSSFEQENGAESNTKDKDSEGYAAKLEVTVPVGNAKLGLMGLYSSGDKDFQDESKDSADSFVTPQSVYYGAGAWGYTGKMNVQWPLDTGVDDPINIDGATYANQNNWGLGITTVQAKATFPIIENIDGYVGAGYFKLNDAPEGQKKKLGTDIYAQAHITIKEHLHLYSGIDYASLGKGHHNAYTGTEYKSRDILTYFTQLVVAF